MAVSITAIIIAVTILLYYWKSFFVKAFHIYKASLNFPGPRAFPLIGNMHVFIGAGPKIWNSITELFNTNQSPFRLWMANKLIVCISDPDHIKTVLSSSNFIEKGFNYHEFKVWMGNGLLTAPAPIWRRHRKLIMPTFNLKVLETFVPIFANKLINTTKELDNEINKDTFHLHDYISTFSLESICENAMGIDLGLETEKKHYYFEASNRIMDILSMKWFKPWMRLDFIFKFTSLSTELSRCLKYVHEVTDEVIAKKKSDLKRRMTEEFNETPRQTNFLSLLMELSSAGDTFTDRELRDHVTTMIITGSDTILITLSFALLMLAMYPEAQDKAYQELYNIYGSSDPKDVPVAYKDLQHMGYVDRVIKETLRIFPVCGIIFRSVTEDFKLGTRLLPKGATIMVGIYAVHHNEKYWPDPFKFDPDRFLPEKVKERHPYCYLPFSAGPRNCVGMKYAELLLKMSVATLLRKYIFKQNEYKRIEDIKLTVEIIIKPSKNINLKIEKRQ